MPEGAEPDFLWIKRYELLILRPLDIALWICTFWMLFRRQWLIGILFMVVGFAVGAIGQGLPHRRIQKLNDLARGRPMPSEIFRKTPASESPREAAPEDLYAVTVAAFKTAFLISLCLGISLYFAGFHWYVFVGCAMALMVAFVPLSTIALMLVGWWLERDAIRSHRIGSQRGT